MNNNSWGVKVTIETPNIPLQTIAYISNILQIYKSSFMFMIIASETKHKKVHLK